MFPNLTRLGRHSDLFAALTAMLIVLAAIARAPLPDTAPGWHPVSTMVSTGA